MCSGQGWTGMAEEKAEGRPLEVGLGKRQQMSGLEDSAERGFLQTPRIIQSLCGRGCYL